MKYLGVSLIYLGFFGLVGSAVYFTGSGQCLWALLLTPSLNFKEKHKPNSLIPLHNIVPKFLENLLQAIFIFKAPSIGILKIRRSSFFLPFSELE